MNDRVKLSRLPTGEAALTLLDERGLYLGQVKLTDKECSELSGQALKLALEKPTEKLAASMRTAAQRIADTHDKRDQP